MVGSHKDHDGWVPQLVPGDVCGSECRCVIAGYSPSGFLSDAKVDPILCGHIPELGSLNSSERHLSRVNFPELYVEFLSRVNRCRRLTGSVMKERFVLLSCLLRSASQLLNVGRADFVGWVELALTGKVQSEKVKAAVWAFRCAVHGYATASHPLR